MEHNNYNIKAVTDIYKNAHIALQSISNVLPETADETLKAELSDQYDGYEKIIGEISKYMTECGIEPKDINPVKKAIIWSSIKMKTLVNNSRNQLAEMMINGTVMGINELTAMKNESVNLDQKIIKLLDKLLTLEESYSERLKKFL